MPTPQTGQGANRHQAQDASSRLEAALRLPATNRHVADWLFEEYEDDFHLKTSPLSPESFKNSVNMVWKGHLHGFPEYPDSPDARPQRDEPSTMYLSVIPTEAVNGIALGYAFAIGTPFDQGVLPLRGVLRSSLARVGRVACDVNTRHMVIFRNFQSAGESMLIAIDWLDTNHRQICWYTVPPEEYNFERLPSQVQGLTIADEFTDPPTMVSPSQPPLDLSLKCRASFSVEVKATQARSPNTFVHCQQPIGCSWGDNGNEANHDPLAVAYKSEHSDAGVPVKHQIPFLLNPELEVSQAGSTSTWDSVSNPETMTRSYPSPSGNSPGELRNVRFDGSPIQDCVSGIKRILLGRFCSPSVRRYMRQPLILTPSGDVIGRLKSEVAVGNTDETKLLQTFAARAYYNIAVSVSTDMRLLTFENDDAQHMEE